MATQDVLEEHSEPIKFKKWILKVSIHCEGCKKKVKKILQQVPGVFEIDIDVKQHKVTVIGDVDAATLLRKLIKAGKHAELWPVKVDEQQQQKKQGKSRKSKEKAVEEKETNEQTSKVSGNEKEASCRPVPAGKAEQVHHEDPSKNTQEVGAAKVRKPVVSGGVSVTKTDQEPSKSNQGGAEAKTGGDGVGAANTGGESSVPVVKVTEGTEKTCTVDQVVREAKLEEKKPDNNGREAAQAVAEEEKRGGESDTTNTAGKVGVNDGGNSGKKMKKKGQNGNNTGGVQSSKTPANIGSQNHEDGPPTGSVTPNHSPPHHPSYYAYPPHYYGPAAPVYAVSYNTSHPTSHTASYYAAPQPNSYVYAHSDVPEREAPPPPPSDLDAYPRQPLDSFEIFSDENPNGCSVM